MRWGILLSAFALSPLVGCKEDSSAARPGSSLGGQLKVTDNGAETEDKEVQEAIEVISERVREKQEDLKLTEEYRDHLAEKVAALEARKAKAEEEAASLGKKLSALEEAWNLDGDATGNGRH